MTLGVDSLSSGSLPKLRRLDIASKRRHFEKESELNYFMLLNAVGEQIVQYIGPNKMYKRSSRKGYVPLCVITGHWPRLDR